MLISEFDNVELSKQRSRINHMNNTLRNVGVIVFVAILMRNVLPQSIDDVKVIVESLEEYKEAHFWQVWSGFVVLYIAMQSCGIPGTLFLSILSGALFGTRIGFGTVILTSSTGASLCYMLSSHFAKDVIESRFKSMIRSFRTSIHEHKENVFNYLLFLRMTPFMPNWFINLASPVMGIPFSTFYFATLLGLMPANYLHVTTGAVIHSFQTGESVIEWRTMIALSCVGVISLFPVLYRKMTNKTNIKKIYGLTVRV